MCSFSDDLQIQAASNEFGIDEIWIEDRLTVDRQDQVAWLKAGKLCRRAIIDRLNSVGLHIGNECAIEANVPGELFATDDLPVARCPAIPVLIVDVPATIIGMAVVVADIDPPGKMGLAAEVLRGSRHNVVNLRLNMN